MPLRVDLVYSDQSNIDWKENVSCRNCKTAFVAAVSAQGAGMGRAIYGIGAHLVFTDDDGDVKDVQIKGTSMSGTDKGGAARWEAVLVQ